MKIILIVWLIINFVAIFIKLWASVVGGDDFHYFYILPVSYRIITNKNKSIAKRIFQGTFLQLFFLPCDVIGAIALLSISWIIAFLVWIISGKKIW